MICQKRLHDLLRVCRCQTGKGGVVHIAVPVGLIGNRAQYASGNAVHIAGMGYGSAFHLNGLGIE